MRGEKGGSATVCVAATVILACLVQTIACYRLKKTDRRAERKEADGASTFQRGKIVYGKVFERESGTGKASANASVEDESAYQADFVGWEKGHAYDASSREAAWKRMAPFLLCGGNQMKFKMAGPGVSQLAVAQAGEPPVPVAHVPSNCGYRMQRNPLSLVLVVPYDGCNVVREGGNHVLPMWWRGVPVSLWCSLPVATAPEATQDPPLNAQVPQAFFFPHTHPVDVPEPATTTKSPEASPFLQYTHLYSPFHHHYSHPFAVPTADPTYPVKSETIIPPQYFSSGYQHLDSDFSWPLPVLMPAGTQTADVAAQSLQLPHVHVSSLHSHFPQFVPVLQYPEMVAGKPDPALPHYAVPVLQYPNVHPEMATEMGGADPVLFQPHVHNYPHFHQHIQLVPNPSLST